MTLLETTRLIENISRQYPNVNSIVESGDIFDLNNEEYEQEYAAVCVTQQPHILDEQFITYSFIIYYVDRLVLDKSNKIEIQSQACQFFHNLVASLKDKYEGIDFEWGEVVTFIQRFTAECAGAYMRMNVITTPDTLCPITISYDQPK